MPRSAYLGKPARAVTEYEHDADGRLVRSVTTWDPQVDDDDRAWLGAWLEHEAGKCPGCGHPKDEAWDPANARTYEEGMVICQACVVLQAAHENAAEGPKRRGALRWVQRSS